MKAYLFSTINQDSIMTFLIDKNKFCLRESNEYNSNVKQLRISSLIIFKLHAVPSTPFRTDNTLMTGIILLLTCLYRSNIPTGFSSYEILYQIWRWGISITWDGCQLIIVSSTSNRSIYLGANFLISWLIFQSHKITTEIPTVYVDMNKYLLWAFM